MNNTTRPISASYFGFAQAQHLLSRAGFSGTSQQIHTLQQMGPIDAVNYLVDYQSIEWTQPDIKIDPDVIREPTAAERQAYALARKNNDEAAISKYRQLRNQRRKEDRQLLRQLQIGWLDRILKTTRPLEEKLTLLWHDHFSVNYRGCQDSYLLYKQNQFFRANANGSFATLAKGIVRDPAMLVFLNNDRNSKRKPNENLARELMELFTLGEGHYTENDIKEGARALTGYTRRDNSFTFNQRQHDQGMKKILGAQYNFDGDQFVELLLKQSACSHFVAYKLYAHFVADIDQGQSSGAERVIKDLAMELRRRKYELKPVLKKLFLSQHFYDPAIMGAKIKSPVELVAGLSRTLQTPRREMKVLLGGLNMMGQDLFNPPNVAGWSGGRAWINTSTLFIRQNMATYMITGKQPLNKRWDRSDIQYDAMALIKQLPDKSPKSVVNHLTALLLGSAASDARKPQLVKLIADHDNKIKNDTLIAMLCLITAMPEYQLC